VTARLHRTAPRTMSPPRTSPAAGHGHNQRAWSPPGTRRALSPPAGTQRALTKAAGGYPALGDTRPGVAQDQQQQQQRSGGASRPGTGAAAAKPLGRWSAQRAAREQQRQQQLEAAGQLLSDIDTTLAAGRPVSGRRGGEGSSPGTSGPSRPVTTGVQHTTQQQQQGASDRLVLANDCPPAQQQQQQGGDAGAPVEAVSSLLQASMVLRWQKFNTAAAGEAGANTSWLTGILAEAPKEEASAAGAAAAGAGAGCREHTSSNSCSMGHQTQGLGGSSGSGSASVSGTCGGTGHAAGGVPEQRRDLCHWPGALPGATHGHLSPDKLTFRALPGSKRQVRGAGGWDT
jgi:hypothetical protein